MSFWCSYCCSYWRGISSHVFPGALQYISTSTNVWWYSMKCQRGIDSTFCHEKSRINNNSIHEFRVRLLPLSCRWRNVQEGRFSVVFLSRSQKRSHLSIQHHYPSGVKRQESIKCRWRKIVDIELDCISCPQCPAQPREAWVARL